MLASKIKCLGDVLYNALLLLLLLLLIVMMPWVVMSIWYNGDYINMWKIDVLYYLGVSRHITA